MEGMERIGKEMEEERSQPWTEEQFSHDWLSHDFIKYITNLMYTHGCKLHYPVRDSWCADSCTAASRWSWADRGGNTLHSSLCRGLDHLKLMHHDEWLWLTLLVILLIHEENFSRILLFFSTVCSILQNHRVGQIIKSWCYGGWGEAVNTLMQPRDIRRGIQPYNVKP